MKRTVLALSALLAACGPSDGDDDSIPCNAGLLAGDLVVTEVFADADGADEGKEWFEIYNATGAAIDLDGLVLVASKVSGEDEVTHVMPAKIIEAGDYYVVGGVADDLRPSYVDYGYGDALRVGASRGLPNADGKIGLKCESVTVDEMTWSQMTSGVSKALDGTRSPDYQENDDLQYWCDSNTEYEIGSFGTPGVANDACSTVAPTVCNDNGTDRAVVAPTVGDLVITEVMAAPDSAGNGGPGSDGEWFEVEVVNPVDLNGLQMGQAEVGTGPKSVSTTIASVGCLPVTAGQRLVFAASLDSATNGGLPQADYQITFGLTNSDDGVFIGWGDNPIDVTTWASSSTGASRQLDKDSIDPTSNDEDRFWCRATTVYGTQNQEGTPGGVNDNCDIPPPDGMCFLEGGGMRAIDPPTAGEIAIWEWMVSPSGTDSVREYVEFKALADFDLNGLELGSANPANGPGNVSQTVNPEFCAPITSGDFILAVASDDPGMNGNIPAADIDFVLDVSLPAGAAGGGIFVGYDGTVLDTITYAQNDIDGGVSVQVDPNNTAQTCLPPTTETYGPDNDLGTPNRENVCCMAGVNCPP